MAQAFRFRLQTLLRVRELREREAKRKVGAQRAEIARTDALIEQNFRAIDAENNRLRGLQEEAFVSPVELTRARAWLAHLRRTLAQHHACKQAQLAELEQRLTAYREAHQQAQMLVRLKERKLDAWKRDRTLREQASQDELAQRLHRADASSATSVLAD